MLKNSQFTQGENDFKRPFNNLIIPIANVNYRSEGFDVKDVQLFVDDKDNYYKSKLTRKFHNRWAKKHSLDTAIDESVESYYDYGLTLVKNVNDRRPEVVDLQQIAFCDQTDILSGPICLKHQFAIGELMDMKGKWDPEAVDRAIANSRFQQFRKDELETKTPGKYVEVYELHGYFPNSWLTDNYYEDGGEYSKQVHIITYYTDVETNNKNGITLYRGKEEREVFKALVRDPIFGRACGRGGIEELFHPQVWANYSEIHLQEMLQEASKIAYQTADESFVKKNPGKVKHGKVYTHADGKPLQQIVVQMPSRAGFDAYVNKWEQVARTIGSASDPQLGLNPVSGTPLGTTEIVTDQGEGIHEYRQGKIAQFWGEIYRDWILPKLAEDIAQGDEWVEELSVDEMSEIFDTIATKEANRRFKQSLLSGKTFTKDQQDQAIATTTEVLRLGGNKRFMSIVKDELSDIPLDVDFSIESKQTDLFERVSKLNAIFRGIFANPQVLQVPGMAELFNNILESSGLSPMDYTALTSQPEGSQQVLQEAPQEAVAGVV